MRLCEAYQQSNMIGGDLALVSYRSRPTAVMRHAYLYTGLNCTCPTYSAHVAYLMQQQRHCPDAASAADRAFCFAGLAMVSRCRHGLLMRPNIVLARLQSHLMTSTSAWTRRRGRSRVHYRWSWRARRRVLLEQPLVVHVEF
jgi:hypothetical protein